MARDRQTYITSTVLRCCAGAILPTYSLVRRGEGAISCSLMRMSFGGVSGERWLEWWGNTSVCDVGGGRVSSEYEVVVMLNSVVSLSGAGCQKQAPRADILAAQRSGSRALRRVR